MAITRWDPFRGINRFDPWREVNQLRDQLLRAFDQDPSRREEGFLASAWMPPVDVFETPEEIVLKAELPGVRREDVDIQVEKSVLTLKGERKPEGEVKDEQYYRMERLFGTFFRSFTLPRAVNPDKIRASLSDGVLEVRLPKAEEARPRKITVG